MSPIGLREFDLFRSRKRRDLNKLAILINDPTWKIGIILISCCLCDRGGKGDGSKGAMAHTDDFDGIHLISRMLHHHIGGPRGNHKPRDVGLSVAFKALVVLILFSKAIEVNPMAS